MTGRLHRLRERAVALVRRSRSRRSLRADEAACVVLQVIVGAGALRADEAFARLARCRRRACRRSTSPPAWRRSARSSRAYRLDAPGPSSSGRRSRRPGSASCRNRIAVVAADGWPLVPSLRAGATVCRRSRRSSLSGRRAAALLPTGLLLVLLGRPSAVGRALHWFRRIVSSRSSAIDTPSHGPRLLGC